MAQSQYHGEQFRADIEAGDSKDWRQRSRIDMGKSKSSSIFATSSPAGVRQGRRVSSFELRIRKQHGTSVSHEHENEEGDKVDDAIDGRGVDGEYEKISENQVKA